jgi:predicted transcriptional regulator
MERKRNRLEIIRDILKVIKDKNGRVKPTHVLYKSNLSHSMMKEYLDELILKGFIVEENSTKNKTYSITKKGINYLEEYNTILTFTNSFGLE